jgi:hypothetical protein
MRRLVASGLALLLISGCLGDHAGGLASAPVLSLDGVEQLALKADDARRAALADLQPVQLARTFRGRALQVLEGQVIKMGQRGLRLEERDSVRTLVFWDPRADEAVLQVVAQDRLVSPDQPDPTWAATARQWWLRLAYQGGSWWVVDQHDLTPDRWRSPLTSVLAQK